MINHVVSSSPGRAKGKEPVAAVMLRLPAYSTVSRLCLDRCLEVLLLSFSCLAVIASIVIFVVLLEESLPFFKEVSLGAFLLGKTWAPLFEPRSFGVLPLCCGSLVVSTIAALLAVPAGLAIALFLAEYATIRQRKIIKPALEILAGIPTVVYGYFALCVVTPALQILLPQTQIFNSASAGIVMGIMILPLIASLSDDALSAVPQSLKDSGLALGATKLEVCFGIVFPASLSGITAAIVLAISRALGETMIVALAAGSTAKLSLNPLESIQTLTAFIVQLSLGDTPAGTSEYRSIFAVGLLLFLLTLVLNLVAHNLLKRNWCKYE